MSKKVFIDLDGVMVNLNAGLMEHYNYRFPETRTPSDVVQINNMWADISVNHPTFWFDLQPMDDYKKLYKKIQEIDPSPVILSATPEPYTDLDDTRCRNQKISWVYKYLGPAQAYRTIITKSKLKQNFINTAFDQNILIDDSVWNIDRWRNAGGIAIHHSDIDSTIQQLEDLK